MRVLFRTHLIELKPKFRNVALVAILACLLTLSGCGGGGGGSSSPPSLPVDFSDYYPLTKGTSLDYDVTPAGGGVAATVSQTWTSGLTYNGQTTVRTCESPLEWEDEAYVSGKTLTYAFSDDTGTIGTLDVPIIYGIDNWQAGQTVTSNATVSYGGSSYPFKAEVTYIGIESITVAAGTFPDSIKVNFSINDGVLSGTSWFANGIGLVRETYSDGEVWELTSNNILPALEPLLLSIVPSSGSENGRSLITLTGAEVLNGASMTIGGKLTASIGIIDSASIMAVTPPGTLGPVDVTVINPDCQVAHIEDGFTFNDGAIPPPSVATWMTEVIDDPKFFTDFYSRAIAVDTQGHPHIVYGGDHLYYAYYDGSDWQYEIADTSPKVGRYASIALDASDNVHISYIEEGSGQVNYATNASGLWSSQIVSGSLGGSFASIFVDSSGNVHISYKAGVDVKYATNASGIWVVETVDSGTIDITGLFGENTSIVIDSSDNASIVYFYDTNSSLKYATNASGSWVSETVDDGFNAFAGQHNTLAIDSLGNMHISYYYVDYDTHIAEVRYATNESGSWFSETVFSAPEGGSFFQSTSIALDSSGYAHISYSDWNTQAVVYATNSSGSWVSELAELIGGQLTSIALDGLADAHISYYDYTNKAIKYATNASGAWLHESLDNTTETDTLVGKYTSLAINSADKVHISYFDESIDPFYGSLKHATDASGSWLTEMLDIAGAKHNSLVLDSAGNLHISYSWAGGLRYVTNATGAWVIEMVDSDPESLYTSIAVDSADNIHIIYYSDNPTFGGLRYASNVSGGWVIETVDSGWGIGEFCSIAVDISGKVHISYTAGGSTSEMRYATKATGSWVTETVDSFHGTATSIAVDTLGDVHISYYLGTFWGGLMYATNQTGTWVNEVIDNGAGIGLYTSIGLDSLNNIHVSYYDQVNGDLRHATNLFCAWVVETVDSNGTVGMYSSIALDSTDNAHISYFDEGNGSLIHAATLSIPDFGTCSFP